MNSFDLLARHLLRHQWLARARAAALAARERLPLPELLARQSALLRVTLAAAGRRLPHYADLPAVPADADPRAWLRSYCRPIAKAELIGARATLYPNLGVRRPWWPSGKTSGSTGTPLEVFRSIDSLVWEQAFHWQAWGWAGFAAGRTQAVLRGDPVVAIRAGPPFWRWDRFGRQLFLSTRHLSEANAAAMLDALEGAAPAMLRAYPSACAELARLAGQLGRSVRLDCVVSSSETLYPAQRATIERVFGCRVFDCYGMAERVAFAAQCEHGHYHVHPDYSWVEILDERGEPTEAVGELVGTTLHNRVMPLLRYRSGDRARWLPGACACGRSYPRLELAGGKFEDQLFDRDGTLVSASLVTFAFKGLQHIRKAQVAQVGPGRWEVRIVPACAYGEAERAALLHNFATVVSGKLDVSVRLVDDIALQPSGKYQWVTQEWSGAPRR